MDIGPKLRILGSAVLLSGALTCATWADNGQTILTGEGTFGSIQTILPEGWLDVDHADMAFKGAVTLDAMGELVGAQLETEGLQIRITPNAGSPVYNFVVEHDGTLRTYGLKRVSVVNGEQLRLRGVLIGDGVHHRFDLTNPAPAVATGDDEGDNPLLGGIGPDVTTSRIGLDSGGSGDDIHHWGTSGGFRAYSIGTTSCNEGDETAEWISGSSGLHPVIGQNLFRYHDGRFEQVGQSWLKHSFCAVSEDTCGSCQGTGCSTLGIGCADTYWATLNDGQDGGAKSDINPFMMGFTHSHPYLSPTVGNNTIRGRLQVLESDFVDGAEYFIEGQYVTHDEPLANRQNNASWRHVTVSGSNLLGDSGGQSSVHRHEPAIMAWDDYDANAVVTHYDVPGEGGDIWVGYSVTDNGDGTWHYEYAVQNVTSDKSIGGFSLPLPAGVNVTNLGFHDVTYHSGEIYSGANWPNDTSGGEVSWSTQSHSTNPNANAIRWGTLYNFRFDADTPPTGTSASLAVFKPNTPSSFDVAVDGPSEPKVSCAGDVDGDNAVDTNDLLAVLGDWGPCPGCPGDLDGDDDVDTDDLLTVLGNWGPCP